MAYSDKIYKKEKLISRTFYIDEKLYLELERLSKEVYEASISKLINVAIEELVEKEKIEVTEEDIEAEYKKYADAYNMDIDTIKKAVSAESLKPELASRKAIDLIVDSAVVTEEKAAKKTAEKKPATKKATAKKPAAKKTSEKADDKKSADKAE